MSENTSENIILSNETDPADVEGHFLPLDDEGNTDYAPHRDDEDVDAHVLDLDVERKR